jgi:hypothetical protein
LSLALDGEKRIDPLNDWRLNPRQVEELAARVRPAGRLDDRPPLATGLVETN